MPNGEATTGEILEFLKENMVTKEEMRSELGSGLNGLRVELTQEIRSSELRMMDKMDEKLLALKSDLVVLIRKEDNKLGELVAILKEKKVLEDADVRRMLSLEPFPRAAL